MGIIADENELHIYIYSRLVIRFDERKRGEGLVNARRWNRWL